MPETKKGKNAMKIRNNSRIIALVLALVMILPLISIPVFADATEAPAAPLFSENFDGKTVDDVTASKAKSAIITTAAGKAAGDDALQLTVAGVGAADYYLWQNNNNKWPITEATIADGKISGKTDKGDVTDAELPANDDDDTKTATVGGVSYKVVTGVYADSMGGFTNVAAGTKFKNPAITVADHGKITVELDIYLSEGLKNSSGISGRMIGTKVADGKGQNIELFEIKADGTNATISKHENASISKGEAKTVALGAWVNLIFELDFTAKHVTLLVNEEFAFRTSGLANSYADVASVNENSLQVQIDRGGKPATNAGTVQFDNVSIVDGLSGISYNPNQIKPIHVDFENFEVGADPSSAFASVGGLTGLKVSDKYGSKAMEITFERPGSENKLNVDKNPMIKNPAVSYDSHDKVVHEVSYFFPTDAVGQIQNQFTGSMAKINGAETQSSISWVDVYQIAFKGGTATLKFETGTDSTTQDIFAKTGRYADNHKSYTFATGKWNTVSLVIDLDTGIYEVYLNGELIFDDVQIYRNGICTDITIAANKFITGGKVNKITGAGTFYIDDLKFFEGDAPSVEYVEKSVEDFEDYKYILGQTAPGLSVPSLATVETFADTDNIVVKLPLQGVLEGYALLRADGRKVIAYDVEILETDETEAANPTLILAPCDGGEEEFEVRLDEFAENGLFYAYFTDKNGDEWEVNDNFFDPTDTSDTAYDKYYLVPASVAEIATASKSGQIAKAFKVLHGKYSYADTKEIVLSADYFIEAGSKGIIEAQFEEYKYDVIEQVPGETEGEFVNQTTTNDGSWIQLYYFDLETGRFEGLDEFMKIGEWNNVKVIMNLETGVYEIYLNDALVKTEIVGNQNITIGLNAATSFSAAKIQRTTSLDGVIAGNLYIDNVGVSSEIPADSQYGDGYLSDEAYINNLSNMFVTVKDPSFRFEGYNGIRFATKINQAFVNAIPENFELVNMGTLIAPLDYVQKAGAFTKDALNAIEADTEAKFLDIPFADKFFGGAKGVAFGEEELVFTASIVNIKDENMLRDFAAVAYATIKLPDGSTRVYYAKNFAVSNVVYEAKDTIAKTETFDWTDAELATLQSFADKDVENTIWIESPLGNSKAPDFLWDVEGTLTITDRYFYTGFGLLGMNLTITGPESFKIYYNGEILESVDGVVYIENVAGDMLNPLLIGFLDAGEYTYAAVAPLGAMENPAVIESIEAPITAKAPEFGAYYYAWVSTLDGYVLISTENANARIYAFTMNIYPDALEGAGTVKIPVTVGDVVMIEVGALDGAAAEIAFKVATAAGTPITGPAINAEIPAGETLVLTGPANMLAGKIFNLAYAEALSVYVNGMYVFTEEDFAVELVANDFGTVSIFVKNSGEEAITIAATLTLPAAGTIDAPKAIELGAGAVAVAPDGYLTWTAETAGKFTFAVTSMENWVFNITNQNTYAQTDMVFAGAEVPATTVDVAAGDVLVIMIGAYDMQAADVEYVAEFAPAEAEA